MRKTYAHHTPSVEGLMTIRKLREAFDNLQGLIENSTVSSRERACALTNLETTAMWAIKAVVFNDPKSVVEE